jgi:hypothetical protein
MVMALVAAAVLLLFVDGTSAVPTIVARRGTIAELRADADAHDPWHHDADSPDADSRSLAVGLPGLLGSSSEHTVAAARRSMTITDHIAELERTQDEQSVIIAQLKKHCMDTLRMMSKYTQHMTSSMSVTSAPTVIHDM